MWEAIALWLAGEDASNTPGSVELQDIESFHNIRVLTCIFYFTIHRTKLSGDIEYTSPSIAQRTCYSSAYESTPKALVLNYSSKIEGETHQGRRTQGLSFSINAHHPEAVLA